MHALSRKIPLSIILSVVVLLFIALALLWFVQHESRQYYQTQQSLAESTGLGVERTLNRFVQQKRESVIALVEREASLLADLAEFPVDEENLAKLDAEIQSHTPEFFNYMLTDGSGIPLLQEKVLKIGPKCQAGINLFSQYPERHQDTVVLHDSGNGDSHFDVMADLQNTEDRAVFFISFKVEAMIAVLRNAQIPDQFILVVQESDPSKVEISALGLFDSRFGRQLTQPQLQTVLFQKHVANTGWRVMVLPSSAIFSQFSNALIQRSISVFAVLAFIFIFFLWRLWVEEKSRQQAESALQHSHKLMEHRVKQRTEELAVSEHNLRKTFMSAPFGMLVLDNGGLIESINGQAAEIFGYQQDELVGEALEILLPQRFRQGHVKNRQDFNSNPQTRLMGKGRFLYGLRKNGDEFAIEVGLSPLQHSTGSKVIASVSDVSEVSRLQQQLMEQHELAVVTLSSIGDGVITTDIEGNIISVNATAVKLSGWSSEDATGRCIDEVFHVIHEKTREKVINPVIQCLQRKQIVELDSQTVMIHKNGLDIPIEDSAAPIRNTDGEIIGAVLVFHDVSQSRAHANEIEYHANHDALTGLINRREFDSRLAKSVTQSRKTGSENILLFMDLDRFKHVNDTAGHAAGDELLKQLTKLMSEKLRQRDTLARLGGDEFAVILQHCSRGTGFEVANKLRYTVENFRFFWQDQVFSVGVSIGLLSFSKDAISADDILSKADAACYTAKEGGRNRVHVYDATAARKRSESIILNMLEKAFENGRMHLFQQKISATDSTQKTQHCEILLRMESESGELLSPGTFLPAAERYGLATTLDRWVVKTSFEWLQQYQQNHNSPLVMAINLSGQSITDSAFRDFIRQQFSKYAISSDSICFEITETAAMNNLENAKSFIQELKQLGCKFSLDDFGSGHASYAHLKHLPVDFLKIDGQFVKDIVDDPINLSIVRSVNDVGHALGLKTIGEFVENEDISSRLSELGVDYLQGYGIAKPAPLGEISGAVVRQQSTG